MEKWKFPHGEDLTPTGVNNTSIEIFLDNIADSLTREVIQNSLDAHDSKVSDPVLVKFDFYDIDSSRIPDIESIKKFALPKAFEMWNTINNVDTLKFLDRFNEVLNEPIVPVLKISDYNTKGLNQKNYRSLVLGNAYSEKDNENSAGSKGIGKAAPFAASDLRMVFYNTVPTEEEPRSAGVMNFVSFEFDDEGKQITQERATCFEEDKKFISKQSVFDTNLRKVDEYGTDLFILGLKQFDESWSERISLSVVNNFLISIMHNELEVIIDNEKLNHENLKEKMQRLKELNLKGEEKAIFNSTLNYYDVMTNPKRIKIHLDDRFSKYPFFESVEDGTLYLLQHEPANRTILQTRKAGMKIYERNRISGNINFTGVFQATGDKLDSFLKDMENANHNIWSKDRIIGDDRKLARDLLLDLLRWYKDEVKKAYEVSGENDIEAFGVSDFLPMNESRDDDGKTTIDSGIKNKIEKIKVNRKSKSVELYSDDGDKDDKFLKRALDDAGIEDGTEGGSTGRGGANGGGQGGPHVPGSDDGNNSDSGDEDVKAQKEKRVSANNSVALKIIGINPGEGKYRIVGKALKTSEDLEIGLRYVGADGKAYLIKVLSAYSKDILVEHKKNLIRVKGMKKDSRINIDFKVKSKIPMKMEGTVYEVKG